MITDKQYQALRKMCMALYESSSNWLPYIKDFLNRAKVSDIEYKDLFNEVFVKLEFIDTLNLREHNILDDVARRIY